MTKCTAADCVQGENMEEGPDGQLEPGKCSRCDGTGFEADHVRCCSCRGILRADVPIRTVQQHSGREECPACQDRRERAQDAMARPLRE